MTWKDRLLNISVTAVGTAIGIAFTIGTALVITVNSNAAEEIVISVFDWTNNHEREQAEIDARIADAKAEGIAEGTADLERRIADAKAKGFAEGTADLERRIADAKAKGFAEGTADLKQRIADAKAKGFEEGKDDLDARIATAREAFAQGFDQGKAAGRAELERSICPVREKGEIGTSEVVITCPLVDANGQ